MSVSRTGKTWIAACALLLAVGPGSALAAEEKAADPPVYTNADLEKLPTPGNDELPTLEVPEETTLPPAPETAEAAPAPPATPNPADAESMKWVQERVERLRVTQAIEAAQRRLDDATRKIEELTGAARPDGSVFSEGDAAENRLVRGVADRDHPADTELERALQERAAARAELQRLRAEPSGS